MDYILQVKVGALVGLLLLTLFFGFIPARMKWFRDTSGTGMFENYVFLTVNVNEFWVITVSFCLLSLKIYIKHSQCCSRCCLLVVSAVSFVLGGIPRRWFSSKVTQANMLLYSQVYNFL